MKTYKVDNFGFNLYDSVIGPYMGISLNRTRVCDGITYRVALYGAFNAMGLIGPEHNGIVILNENAMDVTADRLCEISSGYFGPNQHQVNYFETLMTCTDERFKRLINESNRNRYTI